MLLMNNDSTSPYKKGMAQKVLVPLLIIVVLAGIWFVKNQKENAEMVETDNSGAVVTDTQGATASESPGAAVSENPRTATSNNPGTAASVSPGTAVPNNPDFGLHVTEKIDLEKLKSYGLPIIIDFGSDSCIPCKEMAPVLKELNAELKGKAIVKFVDVWKYKELSKGYPISVIPTQVFFDAGGKPYNPADPVSRQLRQYTSRETGELVFTTHEGKMTKEQLLDILGEMGMK